MARKRGLGRGLSALIPQTEDDKTTKVTDTAEKEEGTTPANPEKTKRSKPAEKKQTETPSKRGGGSSSRTKSKGTAEKETLTDRASVSPASSEKAKPVQEEVLAAMQTLPIAELEPDPDQPRKTFRQESLEDLAASLKKYGILQPLVVRKQTKKGQAPYVIVAGERRFRAAQLAGFDRVPVVLRKSDGKENSLLSVVENVQREDLTPLEEATAYQEIMRKQFLTQQELGEALGKSRAYVANMVRLLKLDEVSLQALREGKLTSSQGRALLAEPDLTKRKKYRDLLLSGDTSVNKVEKHRINKTTNKDIYISEMEEKLSDRLGTRVMIQRKRKGFKVQLECFSMEDMNRLCALLSGEDEEA